MVCTIKDNEGRIIAYAEYRIVNKNGEDTENDIYCWCNDAWVHSSIQFEGALKQLVKQGLELFPQVKFLYFKRSKHNDRIRVYDIKKFLTKGENSGYTISSDASRSYDADSDVQFTGIYQPLTSTF